MNKKLYKLGLTRELEQYFNENFNGYSLGRISVQYRNIYKIESLEREILGSVSGKMKYKLENKEDYPAVGDWVVFKSNDGSNAIIHNILPRKTIICRKVAGDKSDEQILATNVDKIFIAMSLNKDFNLRRLERYINIAWDSGATPIVILTKSDLCNDLDNKLNSISEVAVGIDIIAVSVLNGDGTRALELCIDYIKSKPFGESDDIILTCNIENYNAIHMYKKIGFKDTGDVDGDEIIMKLVL